MVDPAGKTANRNGKWLESDINHNLHKAGYYELNAAEKKQFLAEDGSLGVCDKPAWFVEQVALHRNIYDAKWKLDFFVYHKDTYPNGLYIESKWQGTPGSVDEKYVFTVMSLKKLPTPSLLVMDGGGARQGAIKWIKAQASHSKTFTFMTYAEFSAWARNHT